MRCDAWNDSIRLLRKSFRDLLNCRPKWLLSVHVRTRFPLFYGWSFFYLLLVFFLLAIMLMVNRLKRFSIFQSKILDMSRIIGSCISIPKAGLNQYYYIISDRIQKSVCRCGLKPAFVQTTWELQLMKITKENILKQQPLPSPPPPFTFYSQSVCVCMCLSLVNLMKRQHERHLFFLIKDSAHESRCIMSQCWIDF